MKNIIKSIALIFIFSLISCSSNDDSPTEVTELPTGTGKIIFFSAQDINCGLITVTMVDRGSGTLDSVKLPSSVVSCQDTHASMLYFNNLPQGNYSFTATCTGYTWSETITLGNETCYSRALTIGSAN